MQNIEIKISVPPCNTNKSLVEHLIVKALTDAGMIVEIESKASQVVLTTQGTPNYGPVYADKSVEAFKVDVDSIFGSDFFKPTAKCPEDSWATPPKFTTLAFEIMQDIQNANPVPVSTTDWVHAFRVSPKVKDVYTQAEIVTLVDAVYAKRTQERNKGNLRLTNLELLMCHCVRCSGVKDLVIHEFVKSDSYKEMVKRGLSKLNSVELEALYEKCKKIVEKEQN